MKLPLDTRMPPPSTYETHAMPLLDCALILFWCFGRVNRTVTNICKRPCTNAAREEKVSKRTRARLFTTVMFPC